MPIEARAIGVDCRGLILLIGMSALGGRAEVRRSWGKMPLLPQIRLPRERRGGYFAGNRAAAPATVCRNEQEDFGGSPFVQRAGEPGGLGSRDPQGLGRARPRLRGLGGRRRFDRRHAHLHSHIRCSGGSLPAPPPELG